MVPAGGRLAGGGVDLPNRAADSNCGNHGADDLHGGMTVGNSDWLYTRAAEPIMTATTVPAMAVPRNNPVGIVLSLFIVASFPLFILLSY